MKIALILVNLPFFDITQIKALEKKVKNIVSCFGQEKREAMTTKQLTRKLKFWAHMAVRLDVG